MKKSTLLFLSGLLVSYTSFAGSSGFETVGGVKVNSGSFEQVVCTRNASDITVLNKQGKSNRSFPKAKNGSIVKPYQNDIIKIGSDDYIKVQFAKSKTGYVNKRFVVLANQCRSAINKPVQICKSNRGDVSLKSSDLTKSAGRVKSYTKASRVSFQIVRRSNKDYVPIKFRGNPAVYWVALEDITYGHNSCSQESGNTTTTQTVRGSHIFPLYNPPKGNYHQRTVQGQNNPACFNANRKRGRKHAAVDLYTSIKHKKPSSIDRRGKNVRSIGNGSIVRRSVFFYMGTFEFAVKDSSTGKVFRYGEVYASNSHTVGKKVYKNKTIAKTKWTKLRNYPPMLHLEIYSGRAGSKEGALTPLKPKLNADKGYYKSNGAADPNYRAKRSKHQRHQDLIDPTRFVRDLEKKTFRKHAF